MKITTRAEAKKRGLKTYFTGEPCPKGHIAERFVSGRCRICTLEATAQTRAAKRAKAGEVLPPNDWRGYATKITETWRRATEYIIETGRLLNEAKAKVDHGDWGKLIEELPFGDRTAQMLMEIARNPVLSEPKHASDLPPHWYTLYELTKLDDQVLLARIEDHKIHPDMERNDAMALLGRERQHKRNNKPTSGESYAAMAARSDVVVDIDDDEPVMAANKIVMRRGEEYAALLSVELQKLISTPKA